MEKLELKHLAGYLPYWVKVIYFDNIFTITENSIDFFVKQMNNIKPILHPLSDLTKEIEINGEKFSPSLVLSKSDIIKTGHTWNYSGINSENIRLLNYEIIQKLYEWHFDIHGLIEKGLAIDKNTL